MHVKIRTLEGWSTRVIFEEGGRWKKERLRKSLESRQGQKRCGREQTGEMCIEESVEDPVK